MNQSRTYSLTEILKKLDAFVLPTKGEVRYLLDLADPAPLFAAADRMRRVVHGDRVHLRGIIEFSNFCARDCFYCGLRSSNRGITRYRMSVPEILDAARRGADAGIRTIVLQSGEDPFFTGDMLASVIAGIKAQNDVAITISVGIRPESDYRIMRAAGADRYLLKHETADPLLFARLRPGTTLVQRIEHLRILKKIGFQVGSGNMVGLPGQTVDSLVEDIMLLRQLDVEMAGIGPFIPHPDTPLHNESGGGVPATLHTLAVARLVLPYAHLPATTALGSIDPLGRQKALRCGANVVMPDITPVEYKQLYEIYPNKICLTEGSTQCIPCLSGIIRSMGRSVDDGYGHAVERPAGHCPG